MSAPVSGTLFVISAPSGTGKTSLVSHCLKHNPEFCLSVSHTTRPPRQGEIDGKNYHFVSKDEFEAMLNEAAFLESANVFGNLYGTSQAEVQKHLSSGMNVILEIDWQGAQQVRKLFASVITIFIVPPSIEVLKERLHARGLDDKAVIAQRLAMAQEEISHYPEYDYLVVNDDFEHALNSLNSIFRASLFSLPVQSQKLQLLLSLLLSSDIQGSTE